MQCIPGPLRAAVERLARTQTFKAKLPKKFGSRPIYLSAGNHLAVLKPGESRFEGYLLGFVDRFVEEDSIVWDIGGNMGIFTFPAAHKAKRGSVLAFEPDPYNLLLLQRTRTHPQNSDLNVIVVPAAVSKEVGITQLEIPIRGRSANSLAGAVKGTQMGGVRETMTVMTVTLDWMLERMPAPHFIKCDAEGAEAWILEGATRLLAEARPIINIEMPRENAEISKQIFERNNYAAFSAYDPIDPAKELKDIGTVWEVLAVPREKISQATGR